MKLIVEGYPYEPQKVEKVLQGIEAPKSKDGLVRNGYVGYFYNKQIDDCVFFLPKVVINEKHLLLDKYTPEEMIDVEKCGRMEPRDRSFIYGLSVWIYRAVKEFQRLNPDSDIICMNSFSRMDSSSQKVQNTLLDVILSLIRFNNENHDFFMFTLRNIHSGYNKISWTKTISKNTALLQNGRPVYLDVVNKKKQVNFDEELFVIFYSILNYIREKYGFRTHTDGHYQLITGNAFKRWLHGYGKIRLRQIKYKYYSDKALALWNHCYAFFELTDLINSSRQQNDYMLVRNFNIVFEAMIDELLSDKELKNGDLADQPDGKRVDHIYAYEGLIGNNEKVYYIGDSKYYKIGEKPGEQSVYKQYTYARNVIQYNLKLFLNGTGEAGKDYLIYRDPYTEGYNITPNFFISARLDKEYRYEETNLEFKGDEEPMKHFENRLFDRDTLLLQRYDINFLFVLALYAGSNDYAKAEFKSEAQDMFRRHIIDYLEERYQFFSLQKRPERNESLESIVNVRFRDILGKTYRPYDGKDILYLSCEIGPEYEEDNKQLLSLLSQDFVIRDYHLGYDPRQFMETYVENIMKVQAGGPQTSQRKLLFTDFAQEIFLIGGYRADKPAHLPWILEHEKYNVRASAAREGNIGKIRSVAVSVRFLILYEIGAETLSKPRIFLIGSHGFCSQEKMKEMGYEDPDGRYLVYELTSELQFEDFGLNRLVEYGRIEELESRRKNNTLKEGWEEEWKGTPLYFSGEKIMKILEGADGHDKVYEESNGENTTPFDSRTPDIPKSIHQEDIHTEIGTVDEEPVVLQKESVKPVDGIWDAFKSVQFRKRFETRLVSSGMNRFEANKRMNYFFLKVKDADQGGIYRLKLRNCKTFDDCRSIIADLFKVWAGNVKFPWVEDLFYKYIDFLKDIYLGQGSLDDSKEDNLKKLSKIELTFPDGHQEVLSPLDALRKTVELIGPDKVSKMNLKVVNDKLIQHYEPAGNKYFESIGDGWWLNTRGTPKSKYQCVRIMLSRANLSIIVKLY